MIEEDEGSYYLEFFNQNLVLVLLSAFIMAPVIPGRMAQVLLIVAAIIGGVFSLVFFGIRSRLMKIDIVAANSTAVTVLASEEAKAMFRVVGSTTLTMVLVVAWLGFARMLWIFESFFVLVAAFHILNMVACALVEMAYMKQDIEDIKAALVIPPKNDPSE